MSGKDFSSLGSDEGRSPIDLSAGVLGRFALLEELGRGGMGVVYRARDPVLGREVALKVIRGDALSSPERRARLLREAAAMARLRHPGIVEVFEVGEQEGLPFFTMRLVDGEPLSSDIAQGRLPVADALRIGVELARVLQFAHAHGMIHRDVKPGNVLMEGGKRPVLLDFGLVHEPEADHTRYTRESQLLGTPMYMAPELALRGPAAASASCDQYALALVIWEMLAGYHPFRAPTQLASLQRALSENVPSLLPFGVPRGVDLVLRRALAREPERRFPDMEAFAQALEDPREPEEEPATLAVPAPAPAAPVEARAPGPRRRVALGLVLLALVGLWLWQGSRARAEANVRADARLRATEERVESRLAAEDWEGGNAAFLAFAEQDANANTPALARAWTWWGERLYQAGHVKDALPALARAYAVASPGESGAILETLIRRLWEVGDPDRAGAALSILALRDPGALRHPAMQAIQADLRLTLRDVDGAIRAGLPSGQTTLARALGQATPLNERATFVYPVDLGPRGPRVALWDYGAPVLRLIDPRDPGVIERVDLPFSSQKAPAVAAGPDASWLLTRTEAGRCGLLDLRAETPRVMGSLACDTVRQLLVVPGKPRSLLVADNRFLGRVELAEDGTGQYAGANRSTNNSNSEVWGLVGARVGDETRVWAATSLWGTYDVRVYREGEEGLEILARRRLGRVEGLTALRYRGQSMVAALQVHDPAETLDSRSFGPTPPHGEARGIHVLELVGDRIERTLLLPLPDLPLKKRGRDIGEFANRESSLMAADLDGDGTQELILGLRESWTCIYKLRPDGSFGRVLLDGVSPAAVVQADDDAAEELVVRLAEHGGALFLLGSGDARLPALAPTEPEATPAPPSVRKAQAERWERTQDLVRMGYPEIAAERLLVLAQSEAGDAVDAAARVAAARLLDGLGEHERAAEIFRRIANDASVPDEALESAFWAYVGARRFAEAREIGALRLATPGASPALVQREERLRAAAAEPSEVVDFGAELPDVEILDAPGLSRDVGNHGLRHRLVNTSTFWRLPLRYDGGPVRIEVTSVIGRVNWGATLQLQVGAPMISADDNDFTWAGGGGGGSYHTRMACPAQPSGWGFSRAEVEGKTFTLAWEYDPADGEASCTLLQDGVERRREVYALDAPPLPAELALSAMGRSLEIAESEVVLQRVVLQGFHQRPSAPAGAAMGRRAFVMGRTPEALAALEGSTEPNDALARLLLFDVVGDTRRREREFQQLVAADPGASGVLARALALYPDRVQPWLRALIGPRALVLGFKTQDLASQTGEDDPLVRTRLLDAMVGLEDLPVERLHDGEERHLLLCALVRTGSAWRRVGRDFVAETLLKRAWALPGYTPAPDARVDDPARQRSYAARELALLSLADGDLDEAVGWLLRAVAASPAPEHFADMLSARADLAPLAQTPGWEAVQAARRLTPSPPTLERAPPPTFGD